MCNRDCACKCVFVCITTINCIWVCYICLWLFTGDCVYACLYDSFSEFVHFAAFVCGCAHACVCLFLRLCMHTGVYESTMANLFPSVCVGGWDFSQHDLFAWSGLNISCWTQTAVKKTTQCFLSWHLQYRSDYTIMFFFSLSLSSFFSLASLMWLSEWSARTDSVSRWSW